MAEIVGKPYLDLYELEEDKRIELIGHRVIDHKETVVFLTDADPGKADRYINNCKPDSRAYVCSTAGIGRSRTSSMPALGLPWTDDTR